MTKEKQSNDQPKTDVRKMSQDFSLNAINFVSEVPEDGISQYLSQNFLNSSTSVGAILAESKAAPTKEEFANKFDQAMSKVNETKYWLTLMGQAMKDQSGRIKELFDEVQIISKIVYASLQTLRGKKQAA